MGLNYEPETSTAMGFGFRCGFLGLLHMEVVQERLEREYDLDLVMTAPSVVYKATKPNGETVEVDAPAKLPDPDRNMKVEEPYVAMEMFTPPDYIGDLMKLAQERRGEFIDQTFLTQSRVALKYN